MAETVIDQGRVWWPAGLPAAECVRIFFNLAQAAPPLKLTLEDYETRAPLEAEWTFEQQGTGKWARWTGATVRFSRPEQQGHSFRWTLLR